MVRTRRGTTVVVTQTSTHGCCTKSTRSLCHHFPGGNYSSLYAVSCRTTDYQIQNRNTKKEPYFHSGVYYTRRGADYVVVRPVRGASRTRTSGWLQNGDCRAGYLLLLLWHVLRKAPNTTEEYDVVDYPEGAVVDALPDGYEVETIDGKEYYVLDDVYYAEVDAPEFEDKIGYEWLSHSRFS